MTMTTCHMHRQLLFFLLLGFFCSTAWASTDLSDPEAICALRADLIAQGAEADRKIDGVFAAALEARPLDVTATSALQLRTETGALFFQASQENDAECSFILGLLGDRMLQPVAYALEEGVESGVISKKDPAIVAIVGQLRACQINPDLPPTTAEKVVLNVKAGNWDYLWSRFRTRYLKKAVLAGILGLSILFNLVSLRNAIKRRRQQKNTFATTA